MILYYSSTGNSKHIATLLHESVGGELFDISKDGPFERELKDDEVLYLVTFNCFWGLSDFVKNRLKEWKIRNVKKATCIMTTGGFLGTCDRDIESTFSMLGLPKPTVYSIKMVTNYSILHDVPDEEEQFSLIKKAEEDLKEILEGTYPPYKSSSLLTIFSKAVRSKYKTYQKTEPFHVKSVCLGCSICAKNCPTHAITLVDRIPTWTKETCDNCLRCLHRCPVEAIEYGKTTEGRHRYNYEALIRKKRNG
ncbi:EFR1 family ferrodoxin [Guggenheimella bovis]